MTTSDTLLPPPDVAAAAVVELASASQSQDADAGLDLLKSIGVYSGTLKENQNRPNSIVVETTGLWRTTDSGLGLGFKGVVNDFWSMMWFRGPSEKLPSGFHALVEAINGAIGTPDDEVRRSNGSRSALWLRPTGDIELYYHVEEPRARDAVQIGIGWTTPDHEPNP